MPLSGLVDQVERQNAGLEDVRVSDHPTLGQCHVANVLDDRITVFGTVEFLCEGRGVDFIFGDKGFLCVDAATEGERRHSNVVRAEGVESCGTDTLILIEESFFSGRLRKKVRGDLPFGPERDTFRLHIGDAPRRDGCASRATPSESLYSRILASSQRTTNRGIGLGRQGLRRLAVPVAGNCQDV